MRKRTTIKKIDNLTARQMTFSKRRRELIKKSQKLSSLCHADVSIIIFSATGKLYDFSSSSTEDTITRYYGLHSNKVEKPVERGLSPEIEESNYEMLCKEVNDEGYKLRQMKGEDLEGLDMEELGQLEKKLEAGLSRVIKTEEERAFDKINKLQRKVELSSKENEQLKQEMKMTLHRGKSVNVNLESVDNVSFGTISIPPLDDDSSNPSS